MTTKYDILGFGSSAVDDLLYVPDYPAADCKTRVQRRERHCGGLTATALVAAARLGSTCAFAGVLGDDELSRFVLDRLQAERIDTTLVRRRADARPVHAVIVVDQRRSTRTIFFDAANTYFAEPDWPFEDLVPAAKVLFLDHYGTDGMIRATHVARAAGVAVVADLESDEDPRFPELLALVDHLILSRSFAAKITGRDDPAAAAETLWSPGRQAAIVTCGAQGCWYRGPEPDGPASHQAAFAVQTVDTTGCGDVFHGAYASALGRGLDLPARVRLAAAAAALKATQRGGQAGIPNLAAVEQLLTPTM